MKHLILGLSLLLLPASTLLADDERAEQSTPEDQSSEPSPSTGIVSPTNSPNLSPQPSRTLTHHSSTEFMAGYLRRKLNWEPLNRAVDKYVDAKGLRAAASTALCSPLAVLTILDLLDVFFDQGDGLNKTLSSLNVLIATLLVAEPGYKYLTRTGRISGERYRERGSRKRARFADLFEKNWALGSALLRILGGAIFTARHDIRDLANDDYEISSVAVPRSLVRAGLIGLMFFKLKAGLDLSVEIAKRTPLVDKVKEKLA